jgi:FtsP/CotA-like multicopper oxidase with cupredoxin domain
MAAPAFADEGKPDATLTIAPLEVEIAPGKIAKTIGFNGTIPGPLLRFPEGKTVTIEVQNRTSIPEITHWHGLWIPSEVDGSMEEGTPMLPPGASARYTFTAKPAGSRWYHTHVMAGRNLNRGGYTAQFGFFYIDPKNEPGAYDAEFFLALRGWDPYMSSMGEDAGMDVAYKFYSVNDRALGHGEPLRVKEGQRVMLRILNASPTKHHRVALAGHSFMVTALDGYAVPQPKIVEVLELGPAERVDAIVTMDNPGKWVFGEVDDRMRVGGLGIVIEYADKTGGPHWALPGPWVWDYTRFGNPGTAPSAAKKIPMVFKQKFAGSHWVDHWSINGAEFPKGKPIRVEANQRYRFIFDNQSGEAHPVHLHRHGFELRKVIDKETSGIVKDVVVVPPWKTIEAEFVADNPGKTLFHCHQQMHMDFGFMALIEYV